MDKDVSKKKNERRILGLKLVYVLGLIGMLSLILAVNLTKEKPNKDNEVKTYEEITKKWSLDKEGNKPVDVKKLGEYMDEERGVLSIYYLLPEINEKVSLIYRSKDVYTRVLVDGEILYETSVYESPLYNKSPGNLWNILNIGPKYSEKCVELQITMVYDTAAVTVDSIYLGDKADIIVAIFGENWVGFVVSVLLMLLGVVLFVVDFLPAYGRTRKKRGLWWIGIYALLTGLWGMIETNTIQFLIENDMRILQLIDNMLMIFLTIPLVMYIDTELGVLQNRLIRVLSYLCVVYSLTCVVSQYTGITDMHKLLPLSAGFMVTTDTAMCIWLIVKCIKTKKAGKVTINCALITLGVMFSTIFSTAEAVRSLQSDRLDRAGLTRIGMLLLCICFAIESQIETYKVVEHGMKYDFVSKLAYSDGLTGLGNRTAYLEQLDEYKSKSDEVDELGVVYLDVNDLKKVNDGLGHEYGDKLIRNAAKIIEQSFGVYGKAYRIGGDEFSVLIEGKNIQDKYSKALVDFKNKIEEKNNNGNNKYIIKIAHGFSICENVTAYGIEDAIARADSEMYSNKAMLKALEKNNYAGENV